MVFYLVKSFNSVLITNHLPRCRKDNFGNILWEADYNGRRDTAAHRHLTAHPDSLPYMEENTIYTVAI